MCSYFGLQMENYQAGDLTDIVRASGGPIGCSSGPPSEMNPTPGWPEFPLSDPLIFSSSMDGSNRDNFFGDPFSTMRDPLFLPEINMPGGGESSYFHQPPLDSSSDHMIGRASINDTTTVSTGTFSGGGGGKSNSSGGSSLGIILSHHQNVFEDQDDLKSPCHIFSRIQISSSTSSSQSPKLSSPVSPCDSPVLAAAAAAAATASPRGSINKSPIMVPSDMINVSNTSKSCLVDGSGAVQISSPRNLGIKRRKSQAKKVVCIPAPAAANSRSSGEVVPSDLWAWRKYGQKPIKGSPYPRGYYRCSSSKGCSARKQVERSRTDPNMLVITYTSEHNHPWPTQRNALAGSTRSQPSKTINAASSSSKSSTANNTSNKEDHQALKESSNETNHLSPPVRAGSSASVKEESEREAEKMDQDGEFGDERGFNQTYKPAMPETGGVINDGSHHEDFFADLGEIEADPLNHLLFSHGFSGTGDHAQRKDDSSSSKSLDPFNIFDWSSSGDNVSNNTSFGDHAKEGGL